MSTTPSDPVDRSPTGGLGKDFCSIFHLLPTPLRSLHTVRHRDHAQCRQVLLNEPGDVVSSCSLAFTVRGTGFHREPCGTSGGDVELRNRRGLREVQKSPPECMGTLERIDAEGCCMYLG